jgi:hypothetical protein
MDAESVGWLQCHTGAGGSQECKEEREGVQDCKVGALLLTWKAASLCGMVQLNPQKSAPFKVHLIWTRGVQAY